MDGLPTGWQSQLDGWLAALQQMRIPGGCEDCHAFHTVYTEGSTSPESPSTTDDCPALVRLRGRA